MFIGHFGAGLAAKKFAPRVSLGTLFLAAQFLDLLWPTLLLLGVIAMDVLRVRIAPGVTAGVPLVFEHYPVSHSLLAVALWGGLLGGLHFLGHRRVRDALVIGFAVVSHWALDLVVHVPDLPLYPGGTRVGLGLWSWRCSLRAPGSICTPRNRPMPLGAGRCSACS